MDPADEALRRLIEQVVDSRLDAWQKATAIAKEPEHKPAPTGWITDRVPEEGDANSLGDVRVPSRFGVGYTWIDWRHVHPGTPWIPPAPAPPLGPLIDNPPPWDPTTLDRNGWVRSRLPTAGDSSQENCLVKVPSCPGGEWFVFQDYALIVPGQPWAPISVTPGPYQP